MGRNSVDATNACLRRAVRANRCALVPRRRDRRPAALLDFFVLLAPDFPVLIELDLLAALLLPEEAAPDEDADDSLDPCAATGAIEITTASTPARHRDASPE